MDYCLMIIVYVNLGCNFSTSQVLLKSWGYFLDWGLWLIVMIGFGLGVDG
jgi:hypothetical protein